MAETPFNPLDITKLGEIIAVELISRPLHPLSPTPRRSPFDGAGVYAIYYDGEFPVYNPLVERNRRLRIEDKPETPIYVGKAIPEGSRKGGKGSKKGSQDSKKGDGRIVVRATEGQAIVLPPPQNRALHKRLNDHGNTISKARTTLNHCHFYCRWLVVEETFISLAEQRLIRKFMPIWNVVLDGFGSNQTGKRRPQQRSQWDTIHPGRPWAARLPDNDMSSDRMLENLARFLAGEEAEIVDPTTAADEA